MTKPINEKWQGKVYFGVKPIRYELTGYTGDISYMWLVRQIDLEKLDVYDYWNFKSRGSTCLGDDQNPGKFLYYVHDWEAFCRGFSYQRWQEFQD